MCERILAWVGDGGQDEDEDIELLIMRMLRSASENWIPMHVRYGMVWSSETRNVNRVAGSGDIGDVCESIHFSQGGKIGTLLWFSPGRRGGGGRKYPLITSTCSVYGYILLTARPI